MAQTQKGTAVWWGTAGEGTLTVSIGTLYTDTLTYARTSDVREITDGQGDTKGVVFHNHNATARFSGTVFSTTKALAATQLAALTPEAGTLVTVTNSGTDDIDTRNTGKYLCMSATQNRTSTGPCTVDLELKQWEHTDLTTTMS